MGLGLGLGLGLGIAAEAGETATPVCRCQRRGGDAAQAAREAVVRGLWLLCRCQTRSGVEAMRRLRRLRRPRLSCKGARAGAAARQHGKLCACACACMCMCMYRRREPSSYFVGPSCVFVCVHLRTFLVGRQSHSCVCRVGTPPALIQILAAHRQRRRQRRGRGRCGGRCRARRASSPGRRRARPPHAARRSGWPAAARRPWPREPRVRTW